MKTLSEKIYKRTKWDKSLAIEDVKEKIKDFDTELKEGFKLRLLPKEDLKWIDRLIDILKLKHFGKDLI